MVRVSMRLPRTRLAAAVLLLLAGGCTDLQDNLGEGGQCVRSTQCADGLVCVQGQCSSDLSDLEGEVPDAAVDAGLDAAVEAGLDGSMDGAASDAAMPGDGGGSQDTGTPDTGAPDSGAPDAGSPDAGTADDAGTTDAGASQDSGSGPVDSGTGSDGG